MTGKAIGIAAACGSATALVLALSAAQDAAPPDRIVATPTPSPSPSPSDTPSPLPSPTGSPSPQPGDDIPPKR